MSTTVTDADVLEGLWTTVNEGFVDVEAGDSSEGPVWFGLVHSVEGNFVPGVPDGSYGLEQNVYGQEAVYAFESREDAEAWFGSVTADI